MLTQKTLLMASPIALAISKDEQRVGIADQVAPFVSPLVDQAFDVLPYSDENAIAEIAEQNGPDSANHDDMVMVSTKVAEGVRNAFGQLSTYIKPLAQKLIDRLSWDGGLETDAVTTIHNALSIEYFDLNSPLFESDYYPIETQDEKDMFSNVSTKWFSELQGHFGEIEDVSRFLMVDDSAIQMLVNADKNRVNEIYRDAFMRGGLWRFLGRNQTTSDVWDFNAVDGICVNDTFILYLMVTRFLASMDEPEGSILEHVNGIDLDSLNERLNLLRRGLIITLLSVKSQFAAWAAGRIRVTSRRLEKEQDRLLGTDLITGQMEVGFTTDVIDALTEEGLYSLSEIAIGYAVDYTNDGPLPDLYVERAYYAGLYRDYVESLKTLRSDVLESTLVAKTLTVLDEFQKQHPELLNIRKDNLSTDAVVLIECLREEVRVFVNGLIREVVNNGTELEGYVMNAMLPIQVARALRMTLAARIYELATMETEGEVSEVSRRECLAYATITAITEVYLGVLQ